MQSPTPSTNADRYTDAIHQLHARFLDILPRIQTHAQIRFHHLRCPGRRDDAVAEVIAVAWKWFLRLDEQGNDVTEFVTTLADYAVRHVRSGRRLCGQEKIKDVLSPRAQRLKNFRVAELPFSTQRSHETVYGDPHGQDGIDVFEERLRDNTVTPPPDAAAFRIDWPRFVGTLSERDSQLADFLSLGYSGREAAQKFNLSPGRVTQLRQGWCKGWGDFQDGAAC